MNYLKILCLGIVALPSLCGPFGSALRGQEPWMAVGVAKQDITPTHPVLLAGYGGRPGEHQGVDQTLWERALAIGDRDPIVLVAVDSCAVPGHVVRRVAQRVQRRHGVGTARFVVCSTHTHNAPQIQGYAPIVWQGHTSPAQLERMDRYVKRLEMILSQVTGAALANRDDARLAWGQGQARFGGNRRTLVNGTWRGFGFQRDGPVDHSVPIMTARDREGTVVAVWVNYACHCTTVGSRNYVGGDWAGCANADIERRFPDAVALTTIGCGADVGPQPSGSMEIALRHGAAIGRVVQGVIDGPMETLTTAPDVDQLTLQLPLSTIPARSEFARLAVQTDYYGQHARLMLQRMDAKGALEDHVRYPMSVWRFGKQLGIVFLAGEVVVDYAVRLKTELDGARLWINAWANAVPSYIPSRRVLREGGYEAEFSQIYYGLPAPYAPEIEDLIVNGVVKLLGPAFKTGRGQLPRNFFRFPTGRTWFGERVDGWLGGLSPAAVAELAGVRKLAAATQSGFEKLITTSPQVSAWYNYSGTQEARPFLRQNTKGASLAWRTPPIEVRQGKQPVVLMFLGGVGWTSEPQTAGFELSLNGKATLKFDVTRKGAKWASSNGQMCLRYFPTWNSDLDSAGLFYLEVAPTLLKNDQPVDLQVTSLGEGSKRWFALDTIGDVRAVEKILVEALESLSN
ncbi:MAG: neutral/alkaline non-lysosomal ceramidase N-terminal domain-containing protein [Planctomycetota bacterium]|nr:neutral/alkaline non-lysosomal ceramidase N-terminal domain-containing protein [Planctomycetota bacterium]